MMLALHDYESTFSGYPPGGVFNLERRGFHSWMTFILPFMEDSPFYNYVNFNVPWDSRYNAGLFLNEMHCYENPSEPKQHRYWQFPVAHYSANPHLLAVNSFVKPGDVKDAARVFLVGELDGKFLPWGCPYNWLELDSINGKPPTYGRASRDGCQFGFIDGRVEFVSNTVSPDVLGKMMGEDLAGFHANVLHVQIPSAFPCPDDTLWHSWTYQDGGRVHVKRDVRGTVISQEFQRGK
jgi:hypothetical protein